MSGARQLKVEFAPGAGPFEDVGTTYLRLPPPATTGGAAATAPDSVPLSVVGDIDLRFEFFVNDTRNPYGIPISKWNTTGDQRSYALQFVGNRIAFVWTTDGTVGTIDSLVCDVDIPNFLGPVRMAMRITFDANNGAGGADATFYTSDSISGTWTQFGPVMTSVGASSIFNSTALTQIGNINDTAVGIGFVGQIYAAEIRSSIGGTVVGNPNFTIQTPGATSFADTASSPNTWTIVSPAEIVGPAWVDLSDRVLSATWTQGRDDELDSFPAGNATVVMKNDDRVLDPDYTAGTYFGRLLPRVPFRLRSTWSSLRLPGAAGAQVSTPDHASLVVTDLDVRFQLSMDDWTPGGFGIALGGQWTSTTQESWLVGVTSAGNINLTFTTDGSTDLTRTSTAVPGFTDGTDHWIRVTLDVNNGAAGHDVIFYTSEDGVTWTQLGTTVTTAGTVTLFNSTGVLRVGSPTGGLDPTCDMRYFEMRNGIAGIVVASADFLSLEPGTTSFRDSSDKLWTVAGTAVVQIDTDFFTDEFYGFVEGGWEQELAPPEGCNCVVQLVDRIGVIGGFTLPDVFEYSVLSNHPVGVWVLDQADNADQVADISGNGNDGNVVGNVQFDQQPIAPGHRPSAMFNVKHLLVDDAAQNYVDCGRSRILTDPSTSSMLATFIARSEADLNLHELFIHSDGNAPATATDIQMVVGTTGALLFGWVENGGGQTYATASVIDGKGHIVFGQGNGIALDTATLSNSTGVGGFGTSNGVGIGGHTGIFAEDNWDGWIGVVAIFNRLLQEQERQSMLDGYGKLDGERTDEHIFWALDRIGVLPTHRNLDEGSVLMGPADTSGQDALEWIRQVTDTEQGQFYCDHRDGGVFRFVNRYSRFLEDRSTTVQFKFSDSKTDSSPNLVRVEKDDFDLVPNGVGSIVNQANVSWRNGSEAVSDTTSISQYGPRPRDISTQGSTPQLARSAGEWLVSRYAQPRTRIDGAGIFPGADRRGYRAAYQLQIGDRVQVTYHPQEVGSSVTVDLFVEGVEQRLDAGVSWYAHYSLSPVDTFTPWIWGVSLWDQTTYWG